MRVLVVTNMYPSPRRPATGTFVERQVHSLRALGLDIDVTVVDRSTDGRRAYAGAGTAVKKALAAEHYDLVHVMYGGVLADSVVRAAGSVPAVVSICGSELLGYWRAPSMLTRVASPYIVAATRRAARRASMVVVKSRELAEALPSIDPSRVRILPNGVDLERFVPLDQAECQERLGWSPEEFHVLFSGIARPIKRPALARAAVECLVRTGVPGRLALLEDVPPDEVPVHMNASDVVLMTSGHEGSPNIVKEALACEVPVVSVDVGDVGERIRGIEGCHLSRSDADHLASAMREVHRRDRRLASRTAIEELSIDNVAVRLVAVYEEAVQAGARTARSA